MAINSVATVIEYDCDGATTRFPITFTYLDDANIIVKHYDDSTQTLSDLANPVGYEVVSDEVETVATYPIDDKIFITLSMDFMQETDLEPNGKIGADVLDLIHDKLTLMCQQLRLETDSVIGLEVPEPDADMDLPNATLRASRYLAFDALGNATVVSSVDVGTVTISAYGETIVAAANADALQTLAEVYSTTETDSAIDTDVAALEADLGGTGRTTETIKGNADDITDNADDISDISRGYNAISLTNWDSTSTAPQVTSGSAIEANGVMYSVSTNTSISTTDAISGVNYLVFDDDTETFGWNDTAPTWSATLNGWYTAGDRFTGHLCTWDGASSFTDKATAKSGKGNINQQTTPGGDLYIAEDYMEEIIDVSIGGSADTATAILPKGILYILLKLTANATGQIKINSADTTPTGGYIFDTGNDNNSGSFCHTVISSGNNFAYALETFGASDYSRIQVFRAQRS